MPESAWPLGPWFLWRRSS